MALDFDGPLEDTVHAACPLQCRLRHGAAADDQLGDQVDWAGLPINLDLAFSPQQRDKVYAQHLMRKRGPASAMVARRPQLCVCEVAAGDGQLDSTRRRNTSSRQASSSATTGRRRLSLNDNRNRLDCVAAVSETIPFGLLGLRVPSLVGRPCPHGAESTDVALCE